MYKESSQRLKLWRESQRLSQRALCAALDVSQSYIGNIEAGRSEPSRNFLIKLQEKFGVRADYILYGAGDPVETDSPQTAKPGLFDPMLMMLCGASVRRVYAGLGRDLSDENHFNEAVWVYTELVSRMKDPEDGDEMEQIMPEILQMLKDRLLAQQSDTRR